MFMKYSQIIFCNVYCVILAFELMYLIYTVVSGKLLFCLLTIAIYDLTYWTNVTHAHRGDTVAEFSTIHCGAMRLSCPSVRLFICRCACCWLTVKYFIKVKTTFGIGDISVGHILPYSFISTVDVSCIWFIYTVVNKDCNTVKPEYVEKFPANNQ